MKNKNHLRDFLDAQIGDYLTARNIFYSRLISGEIGGKIRRENCRKTLSRDGENYGKIRGRRGVLKKFSEAKTPVRFCIIRGRIIFIELETRGEKPDTKRLARRGHNSHTKQKAPDY